MLEPNKKQPLYVYDIIEGKKKYLDIELEVEGAKFKNLHPINLNEAGSSLFTLMDSSSNPLIMRIEIIMQEDYVVVNFLDRTGEKDILI